MRHVNAGRVLFAPDRADCQRAVTLAGIMKFPRTRQALGPVPGDPLKIIDTLYYLLFFYYTTVLRPRLPF